MKKSKRNRYGIFVVGCWLLVIVLLIYTRFINLGWGLPYPMHPDERNMAVAIQGLNCDLRPRILDLRSCFNPHFFAYGQFPLYVGYFLVLIMKFFDGDLGTAISFSEAALSLRFISTIASMINFIIIIKIINIINKQKNTSSVSPITYLLIVFSPFFIQLAHFGTTESLLMLFFSLNVFYLIKILEKKEVDKINIILLSLFSGLAVATKVSSLLFVIFPLTIIFYYLIHDRRRDDIRYLVIFIILSILFSVIFSPHNLISWKELLSTMKYEVGVARGLIPVFYTRQFLETRPVIFQLTKIFPYALGWPVLILALLGVFVLSWRDGRINLLRFAFLIYFLPHAFLFAKWTRFMAPILPLILIFTLLFIIKIRVINIIKVIIILITILPGVAYLSIYQLPDVRFTASDWIYKNIPFGSYLLSETANVVDIPLPNPKSKIPASPAGRQNLKQYQIVSFDFYELDNSYRLQEQLEQHLRLADYIIIPSRRIYSNHSKRQYPRLSNYYDNLFSGKLGYEQIAEFSFYPKIILFEKTLLEFPDEQAEETWTVFDHPVIRIFKRT